MSSAYFKPERFLNENRSTGFILMEVLVSVTIMAVSVTVLLQSIIASLDANRLTQEYTRAIFLAESKLWEYEQQYAFKLDQPSGESYGYFDPPHQAFSWKIDIESDDQKVEYRFKLSIIWMHRAIEQEYRVETLVPMRRSDRDLKV